MQESALNPQRQEKAKEYARLKRCLSYVDLIFTGFLLLLLLFDDLSHRLIGSLALLPAPAASVYFLFLMVTYGILLAPLNYYRGLVLPRRYGLSFQKFAG